MNNFYLLYGTDKSIINNELDKIIDKLGTSDVIRYSLLDTLIEDIVMDAATISMFSNKKIIIIDDAVFLCANKTIDKIAVLEEYFNNYNKDSYLIFIVNKEKVDTRKKIYKEIKKNGTVIECNKGNTNYVVSYINDYVNEIKRNRL